MRRRGAWQRITTLCRLCERRRCCRLRVSTCVRYVGLWSCCRLHFCTCVRAVGLQRFSHFVRAPVLAHPVFRYPAPLYEARASPAQLAYVFSSPVCVTAPPAFAGDGVPQAPDAGSAVDDLRRRERRRPVTHVDRQQRHAGGQWRPECARRRPIVYVMRSNWHPLALCRAESASVMRWRTWRLPASMQHRQAGCLPQHDGAVVCLAPHRVHSGRWRSSQRRRAVCGRHRQCGKRWRCVQWYSAGSRCMLQCM